MVWRNVAVHVAVSVTWELQCLLSRICCLYLNVTHGEVGYVNVWRRGVGFSCVHWHRRYCSSWQTWYALSISSKFLIITFNLKKNMWKIYFFFCRGEMSFSSTTNSLEVLIVVWLKTHPLIRLRGNQRTQSVKWTVTFVDVIIFWSRTLIFTIFAHCKSINKQLWVMMMRKIMQVLRVSLMPRCGSLNSSVNICNLVNILFRLSELPSLDTCSKAKEKEREWTAHMFWVHWGYVCVCSCDKTIKSYKPSEAFWDLRMSPCHQPRYSLR